VFHPAKTPFSCQGRQAQGGEIFVEARRAIFIDRSSAYIFFRFHKGRGHFFLSWAISV
jgi:hypothetical protein